jgi:hypothetical protein
VACGDSLNQYPIPTCAAEWNALLADPVARICSGHLYKIIIKSPQRESEHSVVPFVPNRAQRRLLKRLHNRNIILKARQLGFSTLICIMWLDHALFNPNQRCGIVAHDRDSAAVIFRDKVKFAYDNIPDEIRVTMPLHRESADELLFGHNNSSIRVATSMRSGTINRLHVSEFGKICAKYPDKAREVVTGSLQAVPIDGITIIESTAEGQGGDFYKMTKRAQELLEQNKVLTKRDYAFHFYAWHDNNEYEMDPQGVVITPTDHEYFDKIEGETGRKLSLRKRAWYIATREGEMIGDAERMWQEYPSTPSEAFQQSMEGTFYAKQLAAARKAGHIGNVPHVSNVPVNTFWDIGNRDGTGIWLHQQIGKEHRFIGYIEAWFEPYEYFIRALTETQYIFGRHYLPHDALHKRQQEHRVASPLEMLQELAPQWRFETVDRVQEIQHGIERVRSIFSQLWFDETNCKEGLAHLSMYRREWNERLGVWKDQPRHDEHSEAADALRQFAQAFEDVDRFGAVLMNPQYGLRRPSKRVRRTGMSI